MRQGDQVGVGGWVPFSPSAGAGAPWSGSGGGRQTRVRRRKGAYGYRHVGRGSRREMRLGAVLLQ